MKRKHLMKRILITLVTVVTVATLHAFVVFNDIPPAFNSLSVQAMESLTIEGTSAFLCSNADVFLLLNEVEIGYPDHLNFAKALDLTDEALTKLESAKAYYMNILALSKGAGYVDHRIERLKRFNYLGFAESNRLNRDVVLRLKDFLGTGNVVGLYLKNIKYIDALLVLLGNIRIQLNSGTPPPVSSFWSLLQQYSDAILLGNYASMVFNHI